MTNSFIKTSSYCEKDVYESIKALSDHVNNYLKLWVTEKPDPDYTLTQFQMDIINSLEDTLGLWEARGMIENSSVTPCITEAYDGWMLTFSTHWNWMSGSPDGWRLYHSVPFQLGVKEPLEEYGDGCGNAFFSTIETEPEKEIWYDRDVFPLGRVVNRPVAFKETDHWEVSETNRNVALDKVSGRMRTADMSLQYTEDPQAIPAKHCKLVDHWRELEQNRINEEENTKYLDTFGGLIPESNQYAIGSARWGKIKDPDTGATYIRHAISTGIDVHKNLGLSPPVEVKVYYGKPAEYTSVEQIRAKLN